MEIDYKYWIIKKGDAWSKAFNVENVEKLYDIIINSKDTFIVYGSEKDLENIERYFIKKNKN